MGKKLYISLCMCVVFVGTAIGFATPAHAACSDSLLGFPAWYRGLQKDDCSVKSPAEVSGGFSSFIWIIALNIIQILMVLVGYAAMLFLIKGGFQYITAAGSPDSMSSAKKTLANAVIGLIIAIAAASIVNAVTGAIK